MGAARQLVIKNDLLLRSKVLGNSGKGLKELCSDLINDFCGRDKKKLSFIAAGTFLSRPTLERLCTLEESESGAPYKPNSDTLERVLTYFGAEISFNQVAIKPRFQCRPKD